MTIMNPANTRAKTLHTIAILLGEDVQTANVEDLEGTGCIRIANSPRLSQMWQSNSATWRHVLTGLDRTLVFKPNATNACRCEHSG